MNGEAEEVRVVDLDKGVERVATQDEIDRGVFYDSADGYRKDNPEFNPATRSAA